MPRHLRVTQEIRVDEFCAYYALSTNHPLARTFLQSGLLLVPRGIAAASTLANSVSHSVEEVSHRVEEDSDADLAREYLLERNFDPSALSVMSFALMTRASDRMPNPRDCQAEVESGINSQWQATCQARGEHDLPAELTFRLTFYDGRATLPIDIRVEEPVPLPFPRQTHPRVVYQIESSSELVPTSAIFVADQLAQLRAIQHSIETVQAEGTANAHNVPLARRLAAHEKALVQARSSVLLSMALYVVSMLESGLEGEEDLRFTGDEWLRAYCGGDVLGSRLFGTQEAVNLNGRFLVQYRPHFPAWFDAAELWWVPEGYAETDMRRGVLRRVLVTMKSELFAMFHDVVNHLLPSYTSMLGPH
ncbi:hypothetical protein JCM11491_000542 [Sporobolomyces phaffii]